MLGTTQHHLSHTLFLISHYTCKQHIAKTSWACLAVLTTWQFFAFGENPCPWSGNITIVVYICTQKSVLFCVDHMFQVMFMTILKIFSLRIVQAKKSIYTAICEIGIILIVDRTHSECSECTKLCWGISLDNWKLWPDEVLGYKDRGSLKSSGFHLWGDSKCHSNPSNGYWAISFWTKER